MATLLFASPEYEALNAKLPVALNVTAREFGTVPAVTVTVEIVLPVPVHVPLAKSE